MPDYSDNSTFSTASGKDYHYVVLQVTLKEKFLGTGSGNLTELEAAINAQAAKGYRLHTITTSNGGSKGLMGGDRIQAPMVFEKIVESLTCQQLYAQAGRNPRLCFSIEKSAPLRTARSVITYSGIIRRPRRRHHTRRR